MQHARIFNTTGRTTTDPSQPPSRGHVRPSRSSLPPDKLPPTKRVSSAGFMSSNQASLIVGSPSIRSSSSSIQAPRSLNPKSSDNTIVVGRHYDRKFDFERSSVFRDGAKRSISHNDSIDLPSTVSARDPTIPVQLTIWFHEMRTSTEDFMVDLNLLSGFKVGDVLEVEPIDNKSTDVGTKPPKKIVLIIKDSNLLNSTLTPVASATTAGSVSTPILNPQLPAKTKNVLQLSLIANPLQRSLDLLPRSLVQVRKISDLTSVEADTIEISIKNLNLARDSMWILTSQLVNSCVYMGKRVSFLHSRVGVIKSIYKDGHKVFSGYIGKNTKIVYRSESAKLVFLIQTSREMWHFEESGEIMFHKLVNNLFPRIFRKWRDKDVHHSITIVLFTSVDLTDIPWTSLGHGERPNKVKEYFRVVVDQVNIFHWNRIMENLRLEFANFKRDILLNRMNAESGGGTSTYSLEGFVLPSVKGNILEAINVGLSLKKDKFTDTDLKHSLGNLILITPGTGLFDVDYNLMLETSKKMAGMDSALDIVCLSQAPLHIVPLFRFKDLSKNGKLSHCVPNWCDVSFFRDASSTNDQWIPRCKIYELQMMGLMENEVNDVEIERFKLFKNEKSFIESMDDYDSDIFKPIKEATDPIEMNYSFSQSIAEDGFSKPFKSGTPQGVHDSLLLMNNVKIPNLRPKSSAAKFNIGTTTSTVLGTVSKITVEGSALSTLYHLKETDEVNSPILKPRSISSGNNSMKSFSISSPPKFDRMHPKIIKTDDILKPKDIKYIPSRRKERERSENSILKRNTQMSTNSLDSTTNKEPEEPTNYFWTEVSNPSKESHSDALLFLKQGKWSQVFPPNIKRNLVKWRSFEAPAALPVFQSIFPTWKELNTKYTTQIYSLVLNFENRLQLDSIDDLTREMIQLRLLVGFQICDSDQVSKVEMERNPGSSADGLIKYYQEDFSGTKIYMMLDNEIHRIHNDGVSIGVQLYRKIEDSAYSSIFKTAGFDFQNHKPLIRTRYADEYIKSSINFIEQKPKIFNWNKLDQLLAGYDDALPEETQTFFKMKFVVMPADIPKNAFFISNEHLTDEEIRVEGLRKLIAVIEKGKCASKDDVTKAKESVPEIQFYTGNLYEFLSEQAEALENTGQRPSSLLASEKLNKSIKIINLAHEIQSPGGLRIVDRTWHFNTHQNCFIGNEFVTWLIEKFEDIDTREDAVAYGQSLMEKKLFKHVADRHGFLDGYYFYELEPEYIDKTYKPGKTSWFSRKKPEREKEHTPVSKNNSDTESFKSPSLAPVESPDLRRIASIGAQLNNNDSDVSSNAESAGSKAKTKKKFVLSKSVQYNADSLKKSYKSEVITVHYDKVHNPEHCYHIRLEWMNTSASFIDETISNWSRLCERHGLKFVETPWKELCMIPTLNAFHSFVDLKLAVNPLFDPEFTSPEISTTNPFYYHLYLLKKTGFLLDNRSALYFMKENIEISYSWGKPSFKYAQFIHKTGSYIVEVRDNGDFFLAPNNMHIVRINAPVSNMLDFDYNLNSYTIDSQKVMLGLKKTCTSPSSLRKIFREAKESWRENYSKDVLPTDI
ncbi:hypothetical protein CANTEDRAFT_103597 [Yamadazyma tenuis ATCC 10573]|uniref:Vacuolar membrane-associated protein IML1 n=1 Tax=Candida tenuis (strain ATCC 10573 / BCRC 21748 / CBS 615 / JCM 9827 / NBRC 10315 / NRRL Y-1498 / VKM Y-70) TaxID=590646 RepID=G3B2F3_CANTC|nr:uncharacterized protein CANTEDRAFT_103597 [Yamadazyma tenuis ATCC 10573]EGV64659.1 hypothetical protein CANTEDRAFT_103597 [Yamadazyma tenuis ATCC 10573]